jgi:hypothetical protein
MKNSNLKRILALSLVIVLLSGIIAAAAKEKSYTGLSPEEFFESAENSENQETEESVTSQTEKISDSEPHTLDSTTQAIINFFKSNYGIDLTDETVNDLVNYIQEGGHLDDWLKENYNLSVGGLIMDIGLIGLRKLLDDYVKKQESQENSSTTDRFVFSTKKEETEPSSSKTVSESSRSDDNTSETEKYPDVLLGDVDLNGKINASDARLCLRKSAKLVNLTDRQFYAADVNKDGLVTSRDARKILRYSAKLVSAF